jgi:hypothetical protein
MPNWCTNAVTISHEDVTKIDAIETALKTEEKNFFQVIRPMPESEKDDWYSWNVNNWGTKWDASVYEWERQDETTITINFDTAWSPPTTLYEFMEEEEYNVDAYYHEGGMSFCGKFQDGYDSYYEYDITDRQSIEDLPEDVVDFADLMTAHEDWMAENEEDEEWDPAEELEKIEVPKDIK